ncbi:extracellular matrix protein 2 [Anguilla anguilla]|uniref:extracellular matrix protein 2 n=1 Tax=Anguilla anguilla TaxID=7936 RepID=UPI0015AE4B26|nr:extracellular matrix protein 2 [Anguilla anguilla]
MEKFALMLWIFLVPLHAYVLQPSADVVAIEDSWSEGRSWYEDGKDGTGEPLPSAGDQDSHGEGGAEQERGPRAEAGEVEREERYDADGDNREDDQDEGKRHEESHREGDMEERRSLDEENKEVMQRGRDEYDERELSDDLEEGQKRGAHRDDDKKEEEEGDENETDERQEDENGKDKDQVGEEMVEVNRNLREYRVEDGRKETEKISSPSIERDISHLSPNPSPSVAKDIPHFDISHLNPTPSPTLHVDQNSSVSQQGLDPFQTPLPTADSTVAPTVIQGPVTARENEEPTFTAVKPISAPVQLWNLTDSSQPRLREEEEGLAPKVTEVKVDSFRDLTNANSDTQERKGSEKERSKVNRPMPKPKKKKTHPGKKPGMTGKKQQNKVKAEDKSKSLKKDKNKKNKKKKQKENKKTENETHFPYFKDDYCPPDCACYGRVVQCSDKVLDKIPYGIPYNARYVLLMNNQISGIQLDLLREYMSLEFLVLSNNLLTDGGIEGAFEGMRHLKRLYLDRNHLESISTDLPLSLEELRLDGNNVSVMSEVAWARCPSLQVLSLNNNSLGPESVPDGVFTPLTNLRTLSLVHNLLTAVPVHLPTNVKELYLRGNRIDQVPGDAFTEGSELLVLDLSANRLTNKGLTKASLRPLAHLENLNLEGNLLKNIPQHLPPTLRTLSLEGNAISSVSKAAFLKLPHLEHLGLSRNQITRVAPGAFWGLPALHQLELGHNVLRQVPRRLPPSLHSVSLVHNKIHSVPRDSFCTKGKDSPLSRLVRVHLEHNLIHLADLDTQAFSCLRGYQVIHLY